MGELSGFIRDKVRFRWIVSVTLSYARMGGNITREICVYLSQTPRIFSVENGEISWLNTDSKRWELMCRLSERIEVSLGSFSLLAAPGILLVSGGYRVDSGCTRSLASVYQVNPVSGLVECLRSLQTPRFAHGAVYFQSTLYLFGGVNDDSPLTQCEEIPLKLTISPRDLPSMRVSRAWINPCLHINIVYITGSGTTDTYDPVSNALTHCPLLNIEINPYALSVISQGNLIVLTSTTRYIWNIDSNLHFLPLSRPKSTRIWSRCSPILINESLFIVSFDKKKAAMEVSVATGEVVDTYISS